MNTLHQNLTLLVALLMLPLHSSFSTIKKPEPPTIYAFIVGVENYRSGFRPLDYATDDAYYLQQYLTSVDGMQLPNTNVKIITDAKATKDNILLELQRLSNLATENDLFIFYFSGHGVPGAFVPFGNDGTNEYSFVAHRDVRNILARCKAKNKLILSDACFSGEAAKASSDYIQRQYYKEMLQSKGTLSMMASSKGDEMSLEAEGHQHGYFTYHLVEGMKGKADDNKNGIITLYELYDYVRYNVAQGTNYKQNPTISDGYDETMPVVFTLENATKPDKTNNDNIEAAWKNAKQKNTETAYNQFIINYPNSVLVDDAREKIDALKQQSRKAIEDDAAEFIENVAGVSFIMRKIKAGTFTMGSSDSEAESNETPHSVRLTNDFSLGKTEVTLEQFKAFIDDTAYETDAETGGKSWVYITEWKEKDGVNWRHDCQGNTRPYSEYKHPVIHVSWNDALAYCKWLSKKTGKTYRLPTEAEWEYAAGNGTRHTKYSWGNGEPTKSNGGNVTDETQSPVNGNSWNEKFKGYNDGYWFTAPVAQFGANDLGLYDMTGNVWEWCSDWYDSSYYSKSIGTTVENPTGATVGSIRVLRGGSWRNSPQNCRVANRDYDTPTNRAYDVGFRVAFSVR